MPRGRPRKNQDDVLFRSAELVGWALGGLEREILQTRERLASLTAQAAKLRTRLGRPAASGAGAAPGRTSAAADSGAPASAAAAPAARGGRRRRRMSAEARKRISEQMKKRWAERRKKSS